MQKRESKKPTINIGHFGFTAELVTFAGHKDLLIQILFSEVLYIFQLILLILYNLQTIQK
jgi:hypothetical protein